MDNSRQLELEAELTRNELEVTLSELRERITPGRLVDQAVEYASECGGGDFVRNIGRQATENPFSLCLIGAGLAWLALSNGRALPPRSRVRMSPGASDYGTGSRVPSSPYAQQGADAVRSAAESSRQAGDALGFAIRSASEQVAEGASSLASAATSTVASTKARAGAATDKLGAAVSMAAEAGRSAADTSWDFLRRCAEQPLVLAGVGLAIGAAVGATLPSTEIEDHLIGDASDRLRGQARNFAQEQYERGKEMAQNAVHEAVEEAGDRVRAELSDGDVGSASAQGHAWAERQSSTQAWEAATAPAASEEPARS
jgi:hypothetical protein